MNEKEKQRCYMSLVGCYWLSVHQDLRPCRGCDEEHLQYIADKEETWFFNDKPNEKDFLWFNPKDGKLIIGHSEDSDNG